MHNIKHSEETKNKIREKRAKQKNIAKGWHHSEEAKKKMSENRKGKKHSEETKNKMSVDRCGEKHPMFGKHHTEETKKKLSSSLKGKTFDHMFKKLSEETKKKISEASKKQWADPQKKEMLSIAAKNRMKSRSFLENSQNTKPELIFENILKALNISFRTQEKLKFVYDFYIPGSKLLIDINGDFWHCNPKFYDSTFLHPIRKIIAKDIWKEDFIRKEFAENNNYKYQAIWEDNLKDRMLIISKVNSIVNNCWTQIG
jgi:G:T-mismatch repair DNA endonuclease (very short patch repair protein)